ncbi:DUF1385 domain-containing protein [Chloroflexota bacterium]
MAKGYFYGGQAVIEGVMMRGQKAVVTVVRRPGGGLAMNTRLLSSLYTGWVRKTPFLRGIIVLIEALVLGIKSLLYSANVSLEEDQEEISGWLIGVIVTLGLGLAVLLFFLAPLFLTRLLAPFVTSSIVFHVIEGAIRVIIFVAYLKLLALVPDIKRLFAYHGAEHKAVNAHEAGVPLEMEAIRRYDTAHVRCGTSFMFIVLVIAILVFAVVGLPSLWLMILSRIVLIPVIAALGYEVTHFGARHNKNIFVRAILAPGMWLQSLTTRQPDDSQLEVAVTALRKAVEIDQGVPAAEAAG